MPIIPAPVEPLAPQYPHVDMIHDWRAQQSVRLLWDRVFALAGRLQAMEKTQGDLVSLVNSLEDQVDSLRAGVGEALAPEQQPEETSDTTEARLHRRRLR